MGDLRCMHQKSTVWNGVNGFNRTVGSVIGLGQKSRIQLAWNLCPNGKCSQKEECVHQGFHKSKEMDFVGNKKWEVRMGGFPA